MATIYHKDGKTIEMSNGVTTITRTPDGKEVRKVINMNPGQSTSINISKNRVNVERGEGKGNTATPVSSGNRRGNTPSPAPRSAGRQRVAPRHVKNTINIQSSTIGNMAVNNRGPTIFCEKNQKFEAGSKNTELGISGGNFSQANIAGVATYNNKDSTIGGGGSAGGKGPGLPPGKILTLDDFIKSSIGSEQKVLTILRSGISAQDFCAILKKGLTIEKIANALEKNPTAVNAVINSMVAYDGENDSD